MEKPSRDRRCRETNGLKLRSALATGFFLARPGRPRTADANESDITFFLRSLRFARTFEQGYVDLGS
jgi:hypothetical protein